MVISFPRLSSGNCLPNYLTFFLIHGKVYKPFSHKEYVYVFLTATLSLFLTSFTKDCTARARTCAWASIVVYVLFRGNAST